MTEPVWTSTRLRVLRILVAADVPVWPLDVAKSTGLTYGAVYHSLRVLYDAGWAVGVTEERNPAGGPPRVRYRLTARGRAEAPALLKEKGST